MLFSYEAFGLSRDGFDPSKGFLRSALVSPMVLATIRGIIALYIFTTIIIGYTWQAYNIVATNLRDVNIPSYTLLTNAKAIGMSFSYFTWLTYWSLGFYFLITSIHTARHATGRPSLLHDRFPRALQLLHSIYYTTVVCFPFLVTIVFWGTMYGRHWLQMDRYEQWINLSVHGTNSVFAVVEIALPATETPPILHLSVLLLILSLYLGLSYLTRMTQGFYVYAWMDPAYGRISIILHVLGYAVGIIAIFGAVWGAIYLRKRLSKNKDTIVSLHGGEEKDFCYDVGLGGFRNSSDVELTAI